MPPCSNKAGLLVGLGVCATSSGEAVTDGGFIAALFSGGGVLSIPGMARLILLGVAVSTVSVGSMAAYIMYALMIRAEMVSRPRFKGDLPRFANEFGAGCNL